ncbi:hypothetical protein [Paludisphaera sp.]|uniref:hypothetical protein n=1 Tax=Paludisphaera sp. TaxID=2017432 RepID=UPI00301BB87B
MTLSRKIADALDESTRVIAPPYTTEVHDGPDRVRLEIAALDSVGVALDALEYAALDRRDWTPQALNAWGERLSARLTYLLEPVGILESDAGAGLVLLRSREPSRRGDVRGYYEIWLGRDGVCRVERVTFDEVKRLRSPARCHFTREVVERLADDIAASSR